MGRVTKNCCLHYKCGRPIWNEGLYCIFHEPTPKDSVAFHNEFLKLIENEEYEFMDFHFPDGFPHVFQDSIITSDVNFARSTFHGFANFNHASFKGYTNFAYATFEEGVIFWNIKCDDCVLFEGTNFAETARFEGANFKQGASFRDAVFNGEAFFTAVVFESVDFLNTNFNGHSDFRSTIFNDSAAFQYAIFNGDTEFSGASFKSAVNLYKATISGSLSFQDHSLDPSKKLEFYSTADFNDLRVMAGADVIFRGIDLSKASFTRTDVSDFHFESVHWPEHIWMGHYKRKRVYEDSYFTEKADMPSIELLYCRLKECYTRHGDYLLAGDFHIGEMEMKRRKLEWYRPDKLILWLYKGISFYGERWFRPLMVLLTLLMLFSLTEIMLGIQMGSKIIRWDGNLSFNFLEVTKNFLDVASYGLQVATLQRPSDVNQAQDGTRFVVTIWGITAPALIALSLLAMKRRFRR